jgi:phage baseplate assembly protein W
MPYTIPVRFAVLMSGHRQAHYQTEQESIARHIRLVLSTKFGECHYDEEYGCGIWKQDYQTPTNVAVWRHELERSLTESLRRNEPRLSDLRVNISLAEEKLALGSGGTIRKRLDIEISGTLVTTSELFSVKEKIYISPVAVD